MMKVFYTLVCTMMLTYAFDGLTLSSYSVKNGETALVKFHSTSSLKPIQMRYEKQVFPFYKVNFTDDEYYALIPISYNEKLGKKSLSFEYSKNNEKKSYKIKSFEVLWGEYKKETLKVDSSRVTLSKKNKKRASKEYKEAMILYAKKSKRFLPMNILQRPLKSVITSAFGNERLFNKVRKSYHSGVDFRAKVGTHVSSMGFGRVVMVADRFYAGKSIVVDHGQGIYSGYYHMRSSNVSVGDIVDEHEIIGLSGASGRITGPHLHFSMKVHGITVNPLQLMEVLNVLL